MNRLPYFLGILFLLTHCQENPPIDEGGWFKELSPKETGLDFTNQLQETEDFNIIEYLYYYNGGGVAAGDLNGDSLPDLVFTGNEVDNQIYFNQGDLTFTAATETAGLQQNGGWTTGVSLVDINADGWLDIYLCQLGDYKGKKGRNQLYVNQKNGKFLEAAAAYGLDFQGFATQAAFFDYDQDGDLDMYLLCHSVHDPSGSRPDTSQRQEIDARAGDRLFQNQDGQFVDVTQAAGILSSKIGFGLGVALGDLNGDGCDDIYVSNDFYENDYLYYNNCDGTFREGMVKAMGHNSQFSMGNELADINNDGQPDVLTLDMKPESEEILKNSVGADPYDVFQFKHSFGYHYQYPRNMLHLNMGQAPDGDLRFSEIGQLAGLAATDWSWSVLAADFDNDGRKDVFISNGILRRPNDLDYLKFISNQKVQAQAKDLELAQQMPPGEMTNYLFRNEGDLKFSDQSASASFTRPDCATGAAYADFDRDGDLDLVLNRLNAPALIYQNQSEGHFLSLSFQLDGANPFGFGTKVTVLANGERQWQQLYPIRGFQSSSMPTLHFGLGTATTVDSLLIEWPDGRTEQLTAIAADQYLVLQPQAPHAKKTEEETREQRFREVTIPGLSDFQHRENGFLDINREKLMPYLLSTQGPALAVGDVNGDGLDDVFIGGAKQQSARLLLQDAKGQFNGSNRAVWATDRFHEDVDACFVDIDGDQDLDLYVVSGGNEYGEGSPALQDRLYRNDGRGQFILMENALPGLVSNGSCAQALDFDGDGDQDIFVGGRSSARAFGQPGRSFLLQNDGQGNFEEVSATLAPGLAELGMITDACWLPEASTLVVAGEWMPLTCFRWSEGQLKQSRIPASAGWWQSLAAADFDGDGDIDILAGNLGLNSNLQASAEEPLEIYVKDFDQNTSSEAIMTYYRQGQPYIFASKDELTQQLVRLRKRYPEYRKFSESTFEQIFPATERQDARLIHATQLASCYLENDGRGQFSVHPLARELQFSTINTWTITDINNDGYLDALAGGNFFELQPSIGRFDASYGWGLQGDGQGQFKPQQARESGLWQMGQVREQALLRLADGRQLLLCARNNAALQVFEIK